MQTSSTSFPSVLSPSDCAQLRREQPETRLLDVRTPGEYQSVHITGAYNVPLDTLGEHAAEIRQNVAVPIVLVCQSGQRAARAEETLKTAGLKKLYVLDGGVNGWVAAGLPVVRGTKKLPLERQVRIAAGSLAAIGGLLGAFVNPMLALIAAFIGSGLVFAGVTGSCGMAMVLSKLPYNRSDNCDVGAMVRALSEGSPPAGPREARAPEAGSGCCAA